MSEDIGAVKALALATKKDVYLHSGNIEPPADDVLLAEACKPRSEKAYFFVSTYGGYARNAYRMIRCLRHAYEHITVVVAGPCKSAGTLLLIGADELVMEGAAELGPLDVQLIKDDELVERQSGLATGFAFSTLRSEALETFRRAFVDLKLGGRLTTATAASTAADMPIRLTTTTPQG